MRLQKLKTMVESLISAQEDFISYADTLHEAIFQWGVHEPDSSYIREHEESLKYLRGFLEMINYVEEHYDD